MRLCTRESLDRLEEAADAVEAYRFISTIKKLEQGQCPFCKKEDVFRYDSVTENLYCEDCAFQGDSLLLFMTALRLSFPEAVKALGNFFKIDLEWYELSPEDMIRLREEGRKRFPFLGREEEDGS